MEETFEKSILELARGGFLEQVDYEMAKVIDNILDLNTKAIGKRRITVTMELTPDDSRRQIGVSFATKLTLVPTNPLVTSLCVIADNTTGEVCVVENVPQIPGQLVLGGAEQEYPPRLKLIRSA